jgi:hypothetical protein
MQAVCIALRAVSVEHFLPFHQVAVATVFLDQLTDEIEALAVALRAFDAEHVELAFDVAEDGDLKPWRFALRPVLLAHPLHAGAGGNFVASSNVAFDYLGQLVAKLVA